MMVLPGVGGGEEHGQGGEDGQQPAQQDAHLHRTPWHIIFRSIIRFIHYIHVFITSRTKLKMSHTAKRVKEHRIDILTIFSLYFYLM